MLRGILRSIATFFYDLGGARRSREVASSLMAREPGRGRSSRWPAVRAAWLAEHPTCAACGGRDNCTPHHVWPVSWPGGQASELDPANLITLCESSSRNCHLWIGHLGDWKARNPNVRADAAAWRLAIAGRPYPDRDAKAA